MNDARRAGVERGTGGLPPDASIAVLVVDDDSLFSDLIREQLERLSDVIDATVTDGAQPAIEYLAEEAVDCIVSDYQMPGMDGLELLAAVRDDHPDLPFILFTGKGSETIASEAISKGVTDYLQKQSASEQFEILANRIENAVAQHRDREELRTLRRAVEHAGHSIYWTDRGGTIEYVNPAFERTTGYSREEAVGENPRILQSGEHDDAFYEALWETILSGEVWQERVVNRRKDGERYTVDQTIAPIPDGTGEIVRFVAVNVEVAHGGRGP